MPLPREVRYYGFADLSGYGQAALANVRALLNAGVSVQWVPLDWLPNSPQHGRWTLPDGSMRPVLTASESAGYLADVSAIVENAADPVDHDVVIAHAPPEFWPQCFEPGKRNVGFAAWETDRAPAHWPPLMRTADRILVPSRQNAEAMRGSGCGPNLRIVPHIRRHRWCEFSPSDIAAARIDLGIPDGHRVLYTIGAWDPRKALPDLIHTFAAAFTGDDRVSLLIKTGANGHGPGPIYARETTQALATEAIGAAAMEFGRPVPAVFLHAEPLGGDAIDLIHAVGDVFVSMAHGEGWGLGAFEAATLGKPVVMTGWGGHLDYLGTNWPGAIPYRMMPAPVWPPDRPSYFPSQRWAQADPLAAAALIRATVMDPSAIISSAQEIRERIVQDYAEPVVVSQLLEAIA